MANVNWERLARATGIVFVVLAVIGFLVIGDQPKVGDSSTEIASFYTDHRSRVLTGMVIFGFAFLSLIWFVGAVANRPRSRWLPAASPSTSPQRETTAASSSR